MLLAETVSTVKREQARFHSILYDNPGAPGGREEAEEPDFFHDLNLDQIVEAITVGRNKYNLVPFFRTRVRDLDTIAYRQEVMHDLQEKRLQQIIGAFAKEMRAMREHLEQAKKLYYRYEKEWWFLSAVSLYCGGVSGLALKLRDAALKSRGMRAFRTALIEYVESSTFAALSAQVRALEADLSAIRYVLLIKELSITVRHYDAEVDESAAVEQTFAKFKQGAAKDYRVKFSDGPGMNQVQSQVLDRVALLNPQTFDALDTFNTEHVNYLDGRVAVFDREVQFYLAYLEFVEGFERAGLAFCYPSVSETSKEIACAGAFDLALACKLVREKVEVVCNDFHLHGAERIFVVSGPNQGGKTTFARTFGQIHFLACLGCPVPGTQARLFLFDRLFSHFERAEDISNLRGKLEDDLVRIKKVLDRATPKSIVIMNEIFSSTSLEDAVDLGGKVLARVSQLDLLCVCVTFLDELASFDAKCVSLVSTVDPQDIAVRTYKVERRPADGLSYALAIARKYRLTYDLMRERIKS